MHHTDSDADWLPSATAAEFNCRTVRCSLVAARPANRILATLAYQNAYTLSVPTRPMDQGENCLEIKSSLLLFLTYWRYVSYIIGLAAQVIPSRLFLMLYNSP